MFARTSVAPLVLEPLQVHIWKADLQIGPRRLDELVSILTADERARAERFHFSRDRRRFIARRAYLRRLTERYLGSASGDLRFSYSAAGKPFLARDCGEGKLSFNISDSGDLAVYAFTLAETSPAIGIDVEQIEPAVAYERIAKHFFSAYEIGALRALPAAEQIQGFFNCWTRKEAYLKAIGDGLALPLDHFDVSLTPGEPAELLRTAGGTDTSHWVLQELNVGCGYAAAVAIQSSCPIDFRTDFFIPADSRSIAADLLGYATVCDCAGVAQVASRRAH
jgi:4'-phosphopantetheinyl transferase